MRRTDHVSLGYLNIPNNEYFEEGHVIYEKKYDKVMFYLATDDVLWCKRATAFQTSDVVFLQGSMENDFAVLAACQGMILSVGTFGWWAAFLVHNDSHKDIIYQAQEFKMQHSINKNKVIVEDYYPGSWSNLNQHVSLLSRN